MFGWQNKVLGLDIGSHNLKWIIYTRNKSRPIIHAWGMEKIPADCIINGRILNKDKLLNSLNEVLKKNSIKASFATISLACPEMIVRTVNLPKLNQKELQKVVEYEAEQYIPGSMENYIIDYRILAKENGENKIVLLKVLIVAVPSKIIENYIELIEELNIKPLSVDFHSNSACRFINRFMNNLGEKNYILIDLGSSNTIITIVEHGEPIISRIIQIGSDDILRTLKNTQENVRKYTKKCEKVIIGDENPEDNMKWDEMKTIELLLKDIYQSMEFYYQTLTQKPMNNILFIGGGSKLKNIGKYIAQQLNIHNMPFKGIFPMKMKNDMPIDMINLFCNVFGLAFREER
ncbi:MAG: type IV pilus assembly protein PilM [Tepidanaerobacteraceae bacterium]|jgi:type IV pilus assembly protein PilM|nr:type IV pilus assembly protein PilM [Tepidanaerobacteraceae bacterium]